MAAGEGVQANHDGWWSCVMRSRETRDLSWLHRHHSCPVQGQADVWKEDPNTNKTHDSTCPQSFPFIQIHAQQPTPKLHLDTHAPINPRHHASEAPHRTDHMH